MSLCAGYCFWAVVLLSHSSNIKDQHKSRLKKNASCKPKAGWNIANLTLLQCTNLYSSTCIQGHREPLSLVSSPSSKYFTGAKHTWRVTALFCLDNHLLLVFFHTEKSLSHQHHYCLLFAYLVSLKGLDRSARGSNLTSTYFSNKATQISSTSPDIFATWRNTVAWFSLCRTSVLEKAVLIIWCLKYKMATYFNSSHQSNTSIYSKFKMLIILLSKQLPRTWQRTLNAPYIPLQPQEDESLNGN